jgi:hypothetical protein
MNKSLFALLAAAALVTGCAPKDQEDPRTDRVNEPAGGAPATNSTSWRGSGEKNVQSVTDGAGTPEKDTTGQNSGGPASGKGDK